MDLIIIPADLAHELHEPLRRHYRDKPSVRVIVERRTSDETPRRPHGPQDRRVGDRGLRPSRSPTVLATEAPSSLPPEAAPYAGRLRYMADVDPDAAEVESFRLVARFQQGDPDAFADLYRQHFDGVYHFLFLSLRNAAQAEDVAQEVFLKAHRALPRYKLQQGASFSSWLLTIARREAMSALRGIRPPEPLDPSELDELGNRSPTWTSERTLRKLVEQLPSRRQQQVFMLRYEIGLSVAETKTLIGASEDSVKSLAKRAVARIRQDIQDLKRPPPDWPPDRLPMNRHPRPSPALEERRTALASPGASMGTRII